MPQANKKRGRRMESKKRKLEDGEGDEQVEQSSKRRKSVDMDGAHDEEDNDQSASIDGAYPPREKVFFGMLDDDEQEFLKNQLIKLETNSFEDEEGPDDVLAAVVREIDGKELKVASSQSCSRLLERVIHAATPIQAKKLFQKFRGK